MRMFGAIQGLFFTGSLDEGASGLQLPSFYRI